MGHRRELEINSDTSMTLTNVDIANRLDVNLDADDDGSETLNAGALSVGTVTVDGTSDNETLNFNSTVTSTTAGITINSAATANLGGTAQAATGSDNFERGHGDRSGSGREPDGPERERGLEHVR